MTNKVYADWIPRESLGERIKRLRNAKGLSMDDVRTISGVSKGVISKIENGHDMRVSTLAGLASALETSVSDLVANVDLSNLKSE